MLFVVDRQQSRLADVHRRSMSMSWLKQRMTALAFISEATVLSLGAPACTSTDDDTTYLNSPAGQLPLGSPCDSDTECKQGRCEQALGSAQSYCTARCSASCPDGTFCNAERPELDECVDPCAFGAILPGFDGTCVDYTYAKCDDVPDRGAHCSDCGCPTGQACFTAISGTECKPSPRDGEPCQLDAHCAEGVCELLNHPDGSQEQICIVPREPGADCLSDRSCASGVCTAGVCSVELGAACDASTPCERCVDHVSPAFCSTGCSDAAGCRIDGWTCVNVQGDGRSCYRACTAQSECAQDFTCSRVGGGLSHGVCMAGEEAARYPFSSP